ncbi:L,D-transpeptidase [Corynebacterium sp. A21]|uniref:L,D-transpeptidase n=1 Tax=Corynebacterium sp. A21 TaxID=3457318 RepID=UPI003FD400FD
MTNRVSGSRGFRQMMAVVTVSSLLLVGCTIDRDGDSTRDSATTDAAGIQVADSQAPPKISVKDKATDISPGVPVTVSSEDKGLEKVTMTNEDGKQIKSKLSDDGMTWTTAEQLGFNRTYTVKATDKNGVSQSVTFQTSTPAATSGVALSPLPDSTVGVGQTIGFRFANSVDDRQAAQDAIEVKTEPAVEGEFYWLNNSEVRWRPAEYWEPGTTVSVTADIYGVDLGNGYYGGDDNATNFTIGDRVITEIDDATKTMTVYRNGEALRTIPVSLGRDNETWATPNGTYIIGDEHSELLMDSTTFGLGYEQGGYSTMVDYATQMSYSGIYVHAAPWSVGQQGHSNTSHGCINVTTEAAAWFQDVVKRGDIVTVKNTVGETLSGYDGLGDWNIPWSVWGEGNVDETSAW